MSYILEALKKAQAERQLGEVPSVHAPSMQVGADAPAGGRLKKPMIAAMAVMAGVIVALLALVWRKGEAPAVTPVNSAVSAPAPAGVAVAQSGNAAPVAAPVAAMQPSAASPATAAAAGVSPSVASAALAPAAPPAPAALPSVASPGLAPSATPALAANASRTVQSPALAALPSSAPVPAGSPSAAPARASAQAPGASASTGEEVTQTARDLPEPIQRALPPIVVGGYIYSKDPADRLLLIDKVLRHEGEEVAPGLVLEKLLPKSAVFSFKGYRYRVPY